MSIHCKDRTHTKLKKAYNIKKFIKSPSYIEGWVYCPVCEIGYLPTQFDNKTLCVCCHCKVRTTPSSKQNYTPIRIEYSYEDVIVLAEFEASNYPKELIIQ